MKRRCQRFLSTLFAAVLVCLSGIPRGYAQITEGYTYTVTIYPGNQGRFASAEPLTVQSDTASFSFSDSGIRITGLRYGDRVGFDAAMDGAVILKDGSKYYSKGIRESGRDNSTVGASSFAVTGDREYVVAYGIRGNMVSYRINYRDGKGKDLLPSRTYYGNIGERPVAAWAYVDGYLPQAYNLTRTLQADAGKNVFTFIYTPTVTNTATSQTGVAVQEAPTTKPEESPRRADFPDARIRTQPGRTLGEGTSDSVYPREIIDLDETEAPPMEAESNRQRHGNPASAIAGAVCAAAGLGALVGIYLLLRKQRKVQDKKEHARKEE